MRESPGGSRCGGTIVITDEKRQPMVCGRRFATIG
jgi:hypothetical protein